MTYKTCKILTRFKTAPHVSVARRMEPFAKHLLNLACWLGELYPSQQSVLALLTAVWDWKPVCLHKNTALPWCFITAVSAPPSPAVLHEGTTLRAAASQQWHIIIYEGLKPHSSQQEYAPRVSPFYTLLWALGVQHPSL